MQKDSSISPDKRTAKNEVNRRYYARHRERLAEEKRQYRKDNPDKISAVKRRYYARNRKLVIESVKLYNEQNPEKRKASDLKTKRGRNLKRLYGIGIDRYAAMFEAQGGCCAICLTHQSKLKRKLHVDHDHATGKVRGLLCQLCNTALGLARDDINILKAAISYLERFSV